MVITEALLRTDKDIEDIYRRHVDTLYRVAYSFMKNGADAEDMVQEAFVRLLRSGMTFDSPQHEKAWLIVTVSNLCKSALPHRAACRGGPGAGRNAAGGAGPAG